MSAAKPASSIAHADAAPDPSTVPVPSHTTCSSPITESYSGSSMSQTFRADVLEPTVSTQVPPVPQTMFPPDSLSAAKSASHLKPAEVLGSTIFRDISADGGQASYPPAAPDQASRAAGSGQTTDTPIKDIRADDAQSAKAQSKNMPPKDIQPKNTKSPASSGASQASVTANQASAETVSSPSAQAPSAPRAMRPQPFGGAGGNFGDNGKVADAASRLSSADAPGATPLPDSTAPEPPRVVMGPPILFEVAWEVCWQLGGIYTVLRTKVESMIRRWGDRYCLIGPYNPQTASIEFEEAPTEGIIRQTLDRLRAQGITCHYGRWLVTGRPRVILLDYRGRYPQLDTDKYLLWKDHGIPTSAGDGEVNDVVAFGFTVTEFFRELSSVVTDRPILAHFHEWMGGVAVPRIAHLNLPVATVFTTHATLLGRYLAGDDPHFYDHLPFVDPDAEAARYNIYPRHAIERAAAHASTVFTTVSEVTATEAEKLLGRVPDAILPNGLNIHRFSALHEFQNLHRQYKEQIHEFVMGHFFPSYNFDLDRTIYLYTSGRYEYRNKGMDLFIEAMHRLNQQLRQMPDPPTVVAFIITRAPVKNINVGVLQNQSMFEDLKKTCLEQEQQMGRRLFLATAHGRVPSALSELIPEDNLVRLKRAIHAWRSNRQPSIVTHDVVDDASDPVLCHLRHRNMFNSADDPVKMVFHPQFITATSPLISLDYEQFVRGCHLGIFGSYYEPWGYTPMESVAMGVPAVTTDLSGFGAYVQHALPDHDSQGICVLNRRQQNFDQACNDLVRYLVDFVQMNRRQRIELRNRVERLSEMFDWPVLARHYDQAHDLALSRRSADYAARMGRLDVRLV